MLPPPPLVRLRATEEPPTLHARTHLALDGLGIAPRRCRIMAADASWKVNGGDRTQELIVHRGEVLFLVYDLDQHDELAAADDHLTAATGERRFGGFDVALDASTAGDFWEHAVIVEPARVTGLEQEPADGARERDSRAQRSGAAVLELLRSWR